MDLPVVNNMRVEHIEWHSTLGKSYAFVTVEELGPNGESLALPSFSVYWGEAVQGEPDDIVKVLEAGNQWKHLSHEVNLFDFFDKRDEKSKIADLEGSVAHPNKTVSIDDMNNTVKSRGSQVFSNVWDAIADDPTRRAELKLRSQMLIDVQSALDKIMSDESFADIPKVKNLHLRVEKQLHKIILNNVTQAPTLKSLLAQCDPDAIAPSNNDLIAFENAASVGREIIDDYYLEDALYHEALDRTYMLQSSVDNALEGHPVILKHLKLKNLYKDAFSSLGKLYQEIGNINPHNVE